MRPRTERWLLAAVLLVAPAFARAAPSEDEAAAIEVARGFATRLLEAPPEETYELLATTARAAVEGKQDPSGSFAMLRTGLRAEGGRVGNVGAWTVAGESAQVDLERLFRTNDRLDVAEWTRLHLVREGGAWKVRGANGLGFDGAVITKDFAPLTPLRAPRGTRSIEGRAVDATGAPLAGSRLVVVQVECADGRPDEPLLLGSTHLRTSPRGQTLEATGARLCEPAHAGPTTFARTNADGAFVITGLPQGLFAIGPMELPTQVVVAPHGTKEVRLAVRGDGPRRTFRGRVVDDDGQPVRGAKVYVEPVSPLLRGEPRVVETQADGGFELAWAGSEEFGAALALHEGRTSSLVLARLDGPAPFSLTLAGTLELRGKLTRADGASYTGPVEVFVPEEARTPVAGARFDGDTLVIAGLPAPEPTIRFSAPGVGTGRALLTRKGRALTFPTTKLKSEVTLVVTGFRADGEPAAGDVVRILSPSPGGTPLELQLDEDGNAALSGATPGPAKIELLDRAGKVVGAATAKLPADGRAAVAVQGR